MYPAAVRQHSYVGCAARMHGGFVSDNRRVGGLMVALS